jgi:hypothetical protein
MAVANLLNHVLCCPDPTPLTGQGVPPSAPTTEECRGTAPLESATRTQTPMAYGAEGTMSMNRVDAGSRLLRNYGVRLRAQAAGAREGTRSGVDALKKGSSVRGRSAAWRTAQVISCTASCSSG